MKKIIYSILIIVVISVVCVSLVACNNQDVLQTQLGNLNIWAEARLPETFEYIVTNKDAIVIGSLKTSVEEMGLNTFYVSKDGLSSSASENSYALSTKTPGAVVTKTELIIDDGSFSQTTYTCFNKNLQLIGSYSKTVANEKETIIVAKNTNNKKYEYKRFVNGTEVSDSIKNGDYSTSPYYDNTMIYFVLRSIPTSYSGYSFSVFDTSNNSKITVSTSVKKAADTDTYKIGENSYSYRIASASSSDKITGANSAISCYITDSYKASNNSYYYNVILKITEGDYTYSLKA